MAEAVSLAEELSQALDAGEDNNNETTITPAGEGAGVDADTAASPGTADEQAQRARDERGRFAKASEGVEPSGAISPPADSAATPAAQPAAAQPVPAAAVDLPPSTWSPEAKAEYLAASPILRGEIKKREMDYQRGITQYKQAAEHGNAMQQAIQPYMPMIQSEGGDPIKSVTSLLNTAYRLRTGSPAERGQMVMAIAQQFGADLSPWMGQRQQQAQGQFDPGAIQSYVQQLVQQQTAPLQQYQQSLLSAQQQQEQAATQATKSQIEQFRTAVNDKGQPAHVYFDNVRALMASLIESGAAKTLDDAYVMSCRAHPEVAKAVEAEQRLTAESQRLEDAKKKANDARKASNANVSGQGGIGLADTSKTSLRDELASQFERSGAV